MLGKVGHVREILLEQTIGYSPDCFFPSFFLTAGCFLLKHHSYGCIFSFIKNKQKEKKKKPVGKICSDSFESSYLRVFICILPLKKQQRWKDGECNHWFCGAWGAKGKFWALCSVVERFLFGDGNIQNHLSHSSCWSSLQGVVEMEKMRKLSSIGSVEVLPQATVVRVTWTVRCFSCVRHKLPEPRVTGRHGELLIFWSQACDKM